MIQLLIALAAATTCALEVPGTEPECFQTTFTQPLVCFNPANPTQNVV